jgi:hypothetical protein
MQLRHIEIANVTVSGANMRTKGKIDIANILSSAKGILVPLMVTAQRLNRHLRIVAAKRRYDAAAGLAEENGGECELLSWRNSGGCGTMQRRSKCR